MATYIPLQNTPLQLQDAVTSVNMSGGSLEFFLAGTSSPTDLFSDNDGTSIGTSIVLNSGGYPESGANVITLFRDQSIALKIVCKDFTDAIIWTADDIPAVASFDSGQCDQTRDHRGGCRRHRCNQCSGSRGTHDDRGNHVG